MLAIAAQRCETQISSQIESEHKIAQFNMKRIIELIDVMLPDIIKCLGNDILDPQVHEEWKQFQAITRSSNPTRAEFQRTRSLLNSLVTTLPS